MTNKITKIKRGLQADLSDAFLGYIKSEKLFHLKDRLLVAVSGGLDSTVLCELCKRGGFSFAIAHCNFQLRGTESDADEFFVRDLAARYGVEFFVNRFDTGKYANEKNISIQVAARELRYDWFKSLLALPGHQFAYVLTAHHADDNVETILMNFFKGTGINGLKGISPKKDRIVRPLLFSRREQLFAFATENQLPWREDSSNSSDKYSRNYFRNNIIPGIIKIFPQAEENLLDNAERFRDINLIYKDAVQQTKNKLITTKGKEIRLPVLKLLKTPALQTIIYEIIKDFNFAANQLQEVHKLLFSESGKYVQSQTHRVLRNRAWLIISPLQDAEASLFLIEEKDDGILFPGGSLSVKKGDNAGKISPAQNIAQLDLRNITFPLMLRKWKTGDYFYPLGMPRKKKLSRFFIDQKLSLNQKESTWVLESEKKIIWVVGLRIDDRFKITPSTQAVLSLTLRPAE